MDTRAGRIDVLDPARSWPPDGRLEPVALDPGAPWRARPELAERIAWLRERRLNIPATVRLMLDATTTCMEGVTPVGLAAHEAAAGVKRDGARGRLKRHDDSSPPLLPGRLAVAAPAARRAARPRARPGSRSTSRTPTSSTSSG